MGGIYWIKDTEKGTTYTKFRGFDHKQDLFELLKKYPNKRAIPYTKERPIHLGESLKHKDQWQTDDFNIFKPVKKTLNINDDCKRRWLGQFKNASQVFTQLIDSEADILGS